MPLEDSRLIDSLSTGLLALDRDGRVRSFNPAAARLTGIPTAEAIGSQLDELMPPAGCRCLGALQRVLNGGEAIADLPGVFQHRSGERIPVSISADPLLDRTGAPDGVVALLRPVAVHQARAELADGELAGIVSKSPAVQRILDILPTLADSSTTVLVLGASGTGKELVARAIHRLSPRHREPFVAVNCGALPAQLLESELFGHVRGAFTDAKQDRPGRFARAEGGTLFLDEIGDMPMPLQVKLLRVLQEREYEPLGGTAPIRSDVRVICATNRDLAEAVQDGGFRADLYYRINVVQLRLPTLAERREDIPLLAQRFIQQFNARGDRTVRGLSRGALQRLMRYDFPGNIRELENIIEHAHVLCPHDEIQEGCLPTTVLDHPAITCAVPDLQARSAPSQAGPFQQSATPLDEASRIRAALVQHGGHRRRSAEALGIDPSTLWRRMKRLGITWTDA